MSTGRKWFLALAVLSTLFFFVYMFPTKVDSAVRGSEVWLVQGYHGPVTVDTRVEAIGWHWSGVLTLDAQASDGASTFTASEERKRDWDDSLSVTKSLASDPKPLHVTFTVTVPDEIREGAELAGTLTGDIVAPQRYQGGFTNVPSTVDVNLTFHVADQSTVTEHSDVTQRWPLAPWLRWLLWLPLVAFVLSTERVSTMIARRINA